MRVYNVAQFVRNGDTIPPLLVDSLRWRDGIIDNQSTWLFTMRYVQPDSSHIRFWSRMRRDSLYVELERTTRHFQLTERQFHWLSEYNR